MARFFSNKPEIRSWYDNRVPKAFSNQFYDFMDRKMVSIMKRETGLSPSPQLTIFTRLKQSEKLYEQGSISYLNLAVGICGVIGHYVRFAWKSKSGKLISISDHEFDEDDLVCWMEGLTPEQYYKDLASFANKKPPFKLKNLPFELEIRDYAYSMEVFITLKDESVAKEVSYLLEQVIVEHNRLADMEDDKKPLQAVHNWEFSDLDDGRIKIYLDAASSDILKKMVKALAERDDVFKVEMDLNS